MPLDDTLKTRLQTMVTSHKVILFMKGNRHFPQCGFSAQVVGLLNELLPKYETFNILGDPEVREGMKEFSSWPTFPQLYVDGQLVGGCDIVKEMYASGELHKVLGVPNEVKVPTITLSGAAAKAFREAADEGSSETLRVAIGPQFQYELFFGPPEAGDVETTSSGLTIRLDRASAKRADGMTIDFVESASGGAFKIDNPNEPPSVKRLAPRDLKAMMERGEKHVLFDVRTDGELAAASVAGAKHLGDDGKQQLEALDKDTPVVFMCHHGQRSRAAAEAALRMGFKKVYNLDGGIDRWSQDVDPKVPRY
jgi:monothiol glutaredoxin